MSTLIITKQSGNFFSLVLDGGVPIISEQNRLTTIGNFCNFKTANGANLILKQNILVSEITLIASGTFTFVNVNTLWNKLIEVGFFAGIYGTGGGGVSIDRFDELLDTFSYFGRDGQLLIVNEAEVKIDTVAYEIFTEADKIKLNGIEAGAQVNVNPDWNIIDPDDKRTILNKPDLSLANITPYPFARLIAAQQDFTIPTGKTVVWANVNGAMWYKNSAELTTEPNTFTQSGTTVTMKTIRPIGNLIIFYIQ
jgi:hypothetical protein